MNKKSEKKQKEELETHCSFCNIAIDDLPFECNYCGGLFCSEHRLPENHTCSKIKVKDKSSKMFKEGKILKPLDIRFEGIRSDFGFGENWTFNISRKSKLGKILVCLGIFILLIAYNPSLLYFLIPIISVILIIAFILYAYESGNILIKATGIVVAIGVFIAVFGLFTGLGLLAEFILLGGILTEITKLVQFFNEIPKLYLAITGVCFIIAGLIFWKSK